MNSVRPWVLEMFLVCFAVADTVSVLTTREAHRSVLAGITAASVLVLCGRKWVPLTASIAAFLLIMVGMSLSPESTGLQFLGMVLIFGVAGAVNRGRDVAVAALVGLMLLAYGTVLLPSGLGWSDLWLSSVFCEGVLVAGWLITRRSHQVEQIRTASARLAALERERSRAALSEQRARIARELHDVVSHGLSVVIVQAHAAQGTLEDGEVGALGRHLDAVERTARDALAEMRRMLGLLELGDGGDQPLPEPPSPGLAAVADLVSRTREAGVDIDASLPGPGVRLGTGVELTVYRTVQEALTNVVRHAPGAVATVAVSVGRGLVDVRVHSSAGTKPGWASGPGPTGRGLVGMRERVRTYDGRLDVGPDERGGFVVHAQIPIDSALSEAGS